MFKKKINIILGAGFLVITSQAASDNYRVNNHWSALGEFVYMRRSEGHNKTLVKDSNKSQCPGACPNYTVLNTKKLVNEFDFEPGYRVGLSYTPNERNSLEASYLWLKEWEGKKTVHGDESLSYPFRDSSFTEDFTEASEATGDYKSQFWDAELNYWYHYNPPRIDYFGLSFIAGLRYFHLNESFSLTMVKPPDTSSYDTHTSNKIGGLQIGFDFQMNPMRWLNWEMFVKGGGMVDYSKAKSQLRDQDDQLELRDAEKHKWQVGGFIDVAAQVGIYFTRWFNLHAGYEMLWLSGLSLATDQLSRSTTSKGKDEANGNAIIHGLYAGLTLSF
jgi:hypothetical protein